MTPDEMDKKIEFILEMQAQFEVNLARSQAISITSGLRWQTLPESSEIR